MSTHIERPDLDNIFQSWKLLSDGSQFKASTTVGGTISSCRKSSASVSQQKPWGNECYLRLFNFPPGPWFLKQGWCCWKSETPEKWGRGRSLAESAGDRTWTAAAAEGLSVAKAPGCGGNKYFFAWVLPRFSCHSAELASLNWYCTNMLWNYLALFHSGLNL